MIAVCFATLLLTELLELIVERFKPLLTVVKLDGAAEYLISALDRILAEDFSQAVKFP